MMKTADGRNGGRQTPGREQMNLSLCEGITGQSADGLRRSMGHEALSLTLITRDGGALQNMRGMVLFHRTFPVTVDKFTTAFYIKCTRLRKQGGICSLSFPLSFPV